LPALAKIWNKVKIEKKDEKPYNQIVYEAI